MTQKETRSIVKKKLRISLNFCTFWIDYVMREPITYRTNAADTLKANTETGAQGWSVFLVTAYGVCLLPDLRKSLKPIYEHPSII